MRFSRSAVLGAAIAIVLGGVAITQVRMPATAPSSAGLPSSAGFPITGQAAASRAAAPPPPAQTAAVPDPAALALIPLPAGPLTLQAPGEFLDRGAPVLAPDVEAMVAPGLSIMSRQVSQAEYAACVQAGGCKPLDRQFRELAAPDRPAVGVSWNDAQAYAAWLSARTGQRWRLPVYAEWVRGAAERYRKEGALPSDPADPSVRWLAEYEREVRRSQGRIKQVQPFGHFGANALGLLDVGGNVWEWTDTCFASHTLGPVPLAPRENCGVRILAGAHLAAMPDFIRDPRNGACSVGLPPSNLGFRLVREE